VRVFASVLQVVGLLIVASFIGFISLAAGGIALGLGAVVVGVALERR